MGGDDVRKAATRRRGGMAERRAEVWEREGFAYGGVEGGERITHSRARENRRESAREHERYERLGTRKERPDYLGRGRARGEGGGGRDAHERAEAGRGKGAGGYAPIETVWPALQKRPSITIINKALQ